MGRVSDTLCIWLIYSYTIKELKLAIISDWYSADIQFLHTMYKQPGHYTQPHVQLSFSFQGIDVRMLSQLNVPLIRKLHGSLMCLAHLLTHTT